MTTDRKGMIRRFSRHRIAEHWLHLVSFFVLAVTGLCQKFYYLEVCRGFITLAGGIDMVRLMHRGTGVFFALLLAAHVVTAIFGVVFFRWQPSMLVAQKDLADAIHNIKYYVGMRYCHALCGRFNYKQKFVYWLTLTGAAIMLATGLALWFPAFTASVLPGQVIPAAKVMHTNHALLIFLLIALWHMYDSVFSPDVFPLDLSIFTGEISAARMMSEHPLELAEMEGVDPVQIKGKVCNEDNSNDPGPGD